MIPKSIHQIWVGPRIAPWEWMLTWSRQNLNMSYELHGDYDSFVYKDKIQRFIDEERYSIAADIMRVEILYEKGGVYIDADSICLEPIEDAPFMKDDFFAAHDYTDWVANGVIGCTPKHPIMEEYMERIGEAEEYWEFGARMLSACMEGKEATILPTCTFYPENWKGNKAPVEGKIYAEQYWGSTKGLYE